MAGRLTLVPLTRDAANDLVRRLHRHHKPVHAHRFAIGLQAEGELIGAAIVGNPVARAYMDGVTAEVIRLVTDGTDNACSMLYAACWRAWRAMGGQRLITYILASEPGTSLRAAGWVVIHETRPRAKGWDTPSRPRTSGPQEAKTLYGTGLTFHDGAAIAKRALAAQPAPMATEVRASGTWTRYEFGNRGGAPASPPSMPAPEVQE